MLDAAVLVLNRSYLPIHVVPLRRAFSLMYRGMARAVDERYETFDFEGWCTLVVCEGHDSTGTIHGAIRAPRVILLSAFDRIPKRHVRFSRSNVYARDGNTCQFCGRTFSRSDLNLDHVIPRSQGGKTTWENVVCSCVACNRRKGGRTPRQARMRLVRIPQRPRWTPMAGFVSWRHTYPEWGPFLSFVDASDRNARLASG